MVESYASKLAHLVGPLAKVRALAEDYFARGRDIPWVIDNVAGRKADHRHEVIKVAYSRRLIDHKESQRLTEFYCGAKKRR